MEVTTEGRKHTLVYNFHSAAHNLDTLAKIRALSGQDTLVIAPHPFYPARTCLGSLLRRNLDVFDAIEQSGFHTRRLDFNRQAMNLAYQNRKPLVGNGDVHLLWQLGRTFLVDLCRARNHLHHTGGEGRPRPCRIVAPVRVGGDALVGHHLWHTLIPVPGFAKPGSVQPVAGD